MSFLAPIFLLGLLSLPIPFILHLFERKRAVRTPFPWLKIVEESITGGNLFLRLREWLLLAIRTLILLLLVLAFANPHIRTEGVPVVLDDSYDMFTETEDGILFEKAKRVALDIAEQRGGRVLLASERRYTPDILPAYRMFQIPLDQRDVMFITSKDLPKRENIIRVEGEKNLFSIDTVYLENPLPHPGMNELVIGITNHSEHHTQIPLSLISGPDTLTEDIYLSPKKNFIRLPYRLKQGINSGWVEIRDDPLQIDNVYYFSFSPLLKTEIGMLGTDEPSFYIQKALIPGGLDLPITIEHITFPKPHFDLLLFIDEPFIPIGPPSLVFIQGEEKLGFVTLEKIDRAHPVFSLFDDASIEEISSRKIYRSSDEKIDGKTIAEFSDGRPAIIERESIIFFLFLPSLENTDIVLSPNFPPLIFRTVRYLREGGIYPGIIAWGRDIIRRVEENRAYEIKKRGSNTVFRVSPSLDKDGLYIRFTPPSPGIYSIDERDEVAVNLDRAMHRIEIDRLYQEIGRVSIKRWFFLGVLGLLLIEMGVRGKQGKRKKDKG